MKIKLMKNKTLPIGGKNWTIAAGEVVDYDPPTPRDEKNLREWIAHKQVVQHKGVGRPPSASKSSGFGRRKKTEDD